MKLLSLLLAVILFIPSADAAVISTTKQKKLPTIANLRVNEDLSGFGFDVMKAPTLNGYDIWARFANKKNVVKAEWFVDSMKLRTRKGALKTVDFDYALSSVLKYSSPGAYEFAVFVCTSNLRKPNERGCATVKKTVIVE